MVSNELKLALLSILLHSFHSFLMLIGDDTSMFSLILVVIIGLGIALFSQQNTQAVPVTVANYFFPSVPVYLIVISSMLFGLILAWILSVLNFFSTSLLLRQKDGAITHEQKRAERLEQKIAELKEENASLRGETHVKPIAEEHVHRDRPRSFFENMRERIAVNHQEEVVS